MYLDHLMQVVRREIERTMRKLHKQPRLGLVQSYDKKKHAVKVQLQPEGTLTGWIPLTAVAIGNQFGVAYAPNIKDQVEIHFQEGDHMVARVMTRHFSKEDKAPELEAGEYAMIHSSGSVLKQSKDGTVRIAGAGDVEVGKTGGGESGSTGTGQQGQQTTPQTDQQQPSKTKAKNFITLTPDGKITVETDSAELLVHSKSGDVTVQSDSGTVYLVSLPKKTKAVTDKGAKVLPVQLVGGVAKSLYAEAE